MSQFILPARATDANNNPLSGALLYFYQSGTSTPQDVFTDSDLGVEHANPVVANAGGLFPPIYTDQNIEYRAVLRSAGGILIDEFDPYLPLDLAAGGIDFLQSGTGAINRTAQDKLRERINLFDYLPGATEAAKLAFVTAGNSVSAYLDAAIDEANSRGGGDVFVHAAGVPYVMAAGVILPHGVRIVCIGGRQFFGADATLAEWASKGVWFQPTGTVNECFTLSAPGSGLVGANFILAQPEPSTTPGTPWTPTTYPYVIKITHSYFELRDICILNATHGVNIEYLQANGGGTYSVIENVWLGCFNQGFRFKNVNDTIHRRGIHHRNMWRVTNENVVEYLEANAIGDTFEYVDNLMDNSIEYFQLNRAQYFKDSNVTAGAFSLTHAASYYQADNVLFNLCRQSIGVENGTTTVSASYGQITVSTDSTTGEAADYAIDLNSNNVSVQFGQIRSAYVGKGILRVGNGTSGLVSVNSLMSTGQGYAQDSPGASAINVMAGAVVTLNDGGLDLQRPLGAGFRKVGDGFLRGPGKVLLTGGTVTAVANVALPLTQYDLYRGVEIELTNMLPVTDGVVPQLVFSTDGGATYHSSAYSYAINTTTDAGANAPLGNGSTTSIALSHGTAMVGNGATEGISLTVRIMGQQATGYWPRATFTGAYVDNSATPQTVAISGAGFHESAGDVDAVRVAFSSGNIASLTYAVYGIL